MVASRVGWIGSTTVYECPEFVILINLSGLIVVESPLLSLQIHPILETMTFGTPGGEREQLFQLSFPKVSHHLFIGGDGIGVD